MSVKVSSKTVVTLPRNMVRQALMVRGNVSAAQAVRTLARSITGLAR